MKKLIVLLLVFLPIFAFSQKNHRLDSIWIPTGTDTTYYMMIYTEDPLGLSFSYKQLTAADAVLDIGETPDTDSLIFNRIDDVALPYTMVDSTVSFGRTVFDYKYMAIKVTKGSCQPGETILLWVTTNRAFSFFPGTTKVIK